MQQPRNFSPLAFSALAVWSLSILLVGMWLGRAGIPFSSGESRGERLSGPVNRAVLPVSMRRGRASQSHHGLRLHDASVPRAGAQRAEGQVVACQPKKLSLQEWARRAGIAIERLAYMRRADAHKLLFSMKPGCGCGQSLGQCLVSSPGCRSYQAAAAALLSQLQRGVSNADARAHASKSISTQPKATMDARPVSLASTRLKRTGEQGQRTSGPHAAGIVRVSVTDAPSLGPKSAALTIVAFVDLVDQARRGFLFSLRRLRLRYGAQNVRIVFRHFPLSGNALSSLAAEASMCAFGQGQFWPYVEKLFGHRGALAHNHLIGYARELKFDLTRFERELSNGRYRPAIAGDLSTALRLRLPGAPYVFINGWPVASRHQLDAVAARAWQRAQGLLAQGVAPARLYDVLTQRGKQTL